MSIKICSYCEGDPVSKDGEICPECLGACVIHIPEFTPDELQHTRTVLPPRLHLVQSAGAGPVQHEDDKPDNVG